MYTVVGAKAALLERMVYIHKEGDFASGASDDYIPGGIHQHTDIHT